MERKQKVYPEDWQQISRIAEKINSAGKMHYMELAMAAKAYIILVREGGKTDKETINIKAKQLGWSIDDNSLEKALSFLEKIELVTWN